MRNAKWKKKKTPSYISAYTFLDRSAGWKWKATPFENIIKIQLTNSMCCHINTNNAVKCGTLQAKVKSYYPSESKFKCCNPFFFFYGWLGDRRPINDRMNVQKWTFFLNLIVVSNLWNIGPKRQKRKKKKTIVTNWWEK